MEEATKLVNKDSKGKLRCIDISCAWNDDYHGYVIKRSSGQYEGKFIQHADTIITCGKAKRTVTEQARLQYNHLVKEYLDKGYKELDYEELSADELLESLPDNMTDANGFSKHMLAKQSEKVKQSSIDKVPYWYASRKIDGVRCSFYLSDTGIHSASRGGGNYDYTTGHIYKHPKIVELFNNHPTWVLDGELYKRGWSLNKISGAARMTINAIDCDQLEYYIYDVMVPDITFEERLTILNTIKEELNLGDFNPEKEYDKGELQIQMVPQEKVSGFDNIMKLHDSYVADGWEGVVVRNPSKPYGFGKRTNDMIKFKKYKDDEFTVIDYELGHRGVEDMVFVCITDAGNTFKAKPMGDREIKEEYVRNFNEKYKDKQATIKFFYFSENDNPEIGVPLQPSLKCFRDPKYK